jgi:hypothetical protein
MRIIKKCLKCKKILKEQQTKFCSHKCFSKNKIILNKFKCKQCKKIFKYNGNLKRIFCSLKCLGKNKHENGKHIFKCKMCKKIFIKYYNHNNKFCSKNCTYKYFRKYNKRFIIDPKIRTKINNKQKRNKTGFWGMTFEQHSINGKKAANFSKKNKIGLYGLTYKDRIINVKKSHDVQRKNKTGFWGLTYEDRVKHGKKSAITNKKNKTGYFDKKWQKINGSLAFKKHPNLAYENGMKSTELRRKHSRFKWKDVKFLSIQERECAKLLLSKPIVGENCHISLGTKTIDFKVNNIFIEYHPKHDLWNETIYHYYKRRRKVLDENGYKNNKLIVFQNLKEVKEWVKQNEK